MLRSSEEQYNILSSFASWLKISPMKLQFKSITRKADSDKHIAMIRKELSMEDNAQCKAMGEDYIQLIKDVGSREALTRRFFLIYQYEAIGRSESDDYSKIYSMLVSAEQNARAYFMQCGNNIIQPKNPDQAVAEILYMFFNRRSCVDEPFTDRVTRVIIDTMAAKGKIIGVDPIPHISVRHFIAPRGLDLSHYNYIVMDGRYYCFLYIKGNGYPSTVRGGWMSSLINAGEGIDIDVHLSRENRSKTIDKVAQRIRLNRTKLKGMQDTSTDYEELTNSIQAGYYIKNGIANHNEDLFYMSVFVTISAKTYDELLWRKQQMTDMLKSMDMYLSDCRFQQEDALRSVMPFLQISPKLQKKTQRNVLTSGAASTYMFTSFEMSDDSGVLLGVNRHNNSLCIVDLFNTKINKNANLTMCGTSGAGKTFTLQLLALRMRMRGIQCYIIAPIKGHEFKPLQAGMRNPRVTATHGLGKTIFHRPVHTIRQHGDIPLLQCVQRPLPGVKNLFWRCLRHACCDTLAMIAHKHFDHVEIPPLNLQRRKLRFIAVRLIATAYRKVCLTIVKKTTHRTIRRRGIRQGKPLEPGRNTAAYRILDNA